MVNLKNSEEKFFSYLKSQFEYNDYVKIEKSLDLKDLSNSTNIFYNKNNKSLWFSRLQIFNSKSIYYFGLKINNDFITKLLLKFNNNSFSSTIRFKNDNVYILINVLKDSDAYKKIKELFSLYYAKKDHRNNFYIIYIGNLNSKNLIKNIELLLNNFIFDLNLNKDFLYILDVNSIDENVSYLNDKNIVLKRKSNRMEKMKKFLEAYNKYGSYDKACKIGRVSPKEFRSWMLQRNKNDEDFIFFDNELNKINKKLSINHSKLKDSIHHQKNYDDNRLKTDFVKKSSDEDKSIKPSKLKGSAYQQEKYNTTRLTDIVKKSSDEDKSINNLKNLFDSQKNNSEDELKIKTVGKLFDEGKSINQVAEIVKIDSCVIDNWIEKGRYQSSESTIELFGKYNKMLVSKSSNKNKNEFKFNNKSTNSSNESKIDNSYSTISEKIKSLFPFQKPRKYQLEIISEIVNAINKGYKYIILEAGTGIGKSVMAATLARIYENSYILTVTKQLQQQYYKDFNKFGFSLVKGRQNFSCLNSRDTTCDKGNCILNENYNCQYNLSSSNISGNKSFACDSHYWKSSIHCPYWNQKISAVNSSVTIANYDFALYDFNFSEYFNQRKLLIMDEAHNIEDKIMNFISLDFNINQLQNEISLNLTKNDIDELLHGNYLEWINFVDFVKEKYEKHHEEIIQKAKNNNEDEDFIKDLEKKLKLQNRNFERFIEYIRKDIDNWICDYDERKKVISFKPLTVNKYTNDYLFKFGEICIFMSATILNQWKFARWLGIDIDKMFFIQRNSFFDFNKNPIYIYKSLDMSKNNLHHTSYRTIPILKEILNKHFSEKGLIHTVSKECAEFIINNLQDTRLMSHETDNRDLKLNEYKSSKNSVLVSPSMFEGVDLPNDLCRFQVIYKIPFKGLNNQVKMRKQLDPDWYLYRAAISLVQTYGRGIRSEDDYCKTYVIDSRFKNFIDEDEKKNKFLPEYMLDEIYEM